MSRRTRARRGQGSVERPVILAFAALASLGLAACGGDISSDSSTINDVDGDMKTIENRLDDGNGNNAALCVGYIDLCERGLALCLEGDNARTFEAFCSSLQDRCAATVAAYCSAAGPCEGQTCSGHGACSVTDGSAVCACDDGYHANGLSCVADAAPARLIGPRPVDPTELAKGTLFASPTGSGNDCTAAHPCDAWTAVGRAAAGDVVFFRGGVYTVTRDLNFNVSGTAAAPILFESYPGEQAAFDGSTLPPLGAEIRVNVDGSWLVLRRLEVRHMPRRGLVVSGNNNLLEGIETHHNMLWGLQVPGSYNVLRDCSSHDNSDVGINGGYDGNNSDGITILGVQNLVSHCLAFGNSDDGIDSWQAIDPRIEYSIVHGNGLGSAGNGHGFKMGGPPPSTGSVVEHSIAYNNRAYGFDWNSGGPVTARHVTSVGNGGLGFFADPASTVENCIAADNGGAAASGGAQANNSWQRGGTVAFISTDPSSPDFLKPPIGGGFEDIGAYAGLEKLTVLHCDPADNPAEGAIRRRCMTVQNNPKD